MVHAQTTVLTVEQVCPASFLSSLTECLKCTGLGSFELVGVHAGTLAPLLTGITNIVQNFDYHAFTSHELFLWYMPEQQECSSNAPASFIFVLLFVGAWICWPDS